MFRIILFILFFIIYVFHIHVSTVLFFYFLKPNNHWYEDNYLELERLFKKLHIKK